MPWNMFQPGMVNDMPVDPRFLLGGSRPIQYGPPDPAPTPMGPDGFPIQHAMNGTGLLAPMDASALGGGPTGSGFNSGAGTMTGLGGSGPGGSLTGSDLLGFQNIMANGNPDEIRAMLAHNNPGTSASSYSDPLVSMLHNQGAADRGDLVSPFGSHGGQGFTSYMSANRAPTPLELQNQAASNQFAHGGDFGPVLRQAAPAFAAAALTGGTSIGGQGIRDATASSGPAYGGSMNFLPGGGGSAEQGQGGLFDSLLGGLGNLSPAILAGYLGNRQRQDVMGQVGRLNTLGDSLSGPAFMNSITNPYDLQTGQGRTALTQNLQQRGVGGSSFGNQQLGNYDYMRGLGRGDLATRAQAGIAGTQGQLYSDALRGMVGGNAAYNQLLGGGLGASGSLFNRPGGIGSTGNGLFDWLRNLGSSGGSPGVPGVPGDPNIDPNTGLPADYPGADGSVIDPNTGFPGMGGSPFDPSIDWGNLYG